MPAAARGSHGQPTDAEGCAAMHFQRAWEITRAIASPRIGVLEIISNGKPGAQGGELAKFRYILQQTENGAQIEEDDLDL